MLSLCVRLSVQACLSMNRRCVGVGLIRDERGVVPLKPTVLSWRSVNDKPGQTSACMLRQNSNCWQLIMPVCVTSILFLTSEHLQWTPASVPITASYVFSALVTQGVLSVTKVSALRVLCMAMCDTSASVFTVYQRFVSWSKTLGACCLTSRALNNKLKVSRSR